MCFFLNWAHFHDCPFLVKFFPYSGVLASTPWTGMIPVCSWLCRLCLHFCIGTQNIAVCTCTCIRFPSEVLSYSVSVAKCYIAAGLKSKNIKYKSRSANNSLPLIKHISTDFSDISIFWSLQRRSRILYLGLDWPLSLPVLYTLVIYGTVYNNRHDLKIEFEASTFPSVTRMQMPVIRSTITEVARWQCWTENLLSS